MILTKKIRLKPTKKQTSLLFQSAGTARWVYNWTLGRQKENYDNGGKFLTDNVLRKKSLNSKRLMISDGCQMSAITLQNKL